MVASFSGGPRYRRPLSIEVFAWRREWRLKWFLEIVEKWGERV
jgi:hypothetical protein